MFCKWQAAINIYTTKFLTFNVFKLKIINREVKLSSM